MSGRRCDHSARQIRKLRSPPERVAIEKPDSRAVSERLNPRESFAGHKFATWDLLRRAYFNGYAM